MDEGVVIGKTDRAHAGTTECAVIGDAPRRREDARFVTGQRRLSG